MNYQQRAQQWQALFRQKQQGSLFSRVLLWLVAGIMLVFAMGVLLFVLMLSWLLIPVFLYKRHQLRKQGKSFFQQAQHQHHGRSTHAAGRVIEGEVLERKNDQ